ncbi:hypothetical protein KFK09_029329 [Dendrobium nobile]|uniref:Polygalacturonase n=1 Tax=Dendrobium nobile TaxID=94219 RepID=A0A8T3A186_DENNO|nr:hypothetical protein KFK09_029329 [Dendrobium nobile]
MNDFPVVSAMGVGWEKAGVRVEYLFAHEIRHFGAICRGSRIWSGILVWAAAEIVIQRISKTKVREALEKMKCGKAVGPDDIPIEIIEEPNKIIETAHWSGSGQRVRRSTVRNSAKTARERARWRTRARLAHASAVRRDAPRSGPARPKAWRDRPPERVAGVPPGSGFSGSGSMQREQPLRVKQGAHESRKARGTTFGDCEAKLVWRACSAKVRKQGHNGTIDGQGQLWWIKYRKKLLNYTRGPLLQIMWSSDIVISNITLRDSPFWTIHPYDCKNVTFSGLTILAPVTGAPNTDGIAPNDLHFNLLVDSCENMVIENSFICLGDDGIAIKSGWDQYGIAYGRPSTNILIRNVTLRSVVRFTYYQPPTTFTNPPNPEFPYLTSLLSITSAGLSIGSEMSGGVSNITIEDIHVWESRRGVRIKTAPGHGGYVRGLSCRNLTLDNVRVGIVVKTDYNEHPDAGYDPRALPAINGLSFVGVHGREVRVPVRISGSDEIPVRGVTFRDMSGGISYKKKHIFQCSYVEGRVFGSVFPEPCENFDRYDEQSRLVKRSTNQNATDIDYGFCGGSRGRKLDQCIFIKI